MQIKKLDISHFEEAFLLFKEVENNLENPLWLYPCTREWLESMLSAENGKALYGAFSDNNELMGVLSFSPTIKEVIEVLNLNEQETIEIGSAAVLPKFRRSYSFSLSVKILKELVKILKSSGYKHIVAKISPDNISVIRTLLVLGWQLKTSITILEKYVRNIYLLNI
jgi:hypothetical protein